MVTREPEWDDASRDRAATLQQYEANLCGCGCGRPASEAYDSGRVYKVHSFTCAAGRALTKVKRDEQEQAKKDKKAEGWDDGRHYYVEPMEVDGGD